MPNIVEYSIVLERMTQQGLRCLYYNSGAFGFAAGVETMSRGWLGPADGSIRESARAMVRQATEPFDVTMVAALVALGQQLLPGVAWVMPKSHWAYELDFGSREWMPQRLQQIGIDWNRLKPLNNAAAIQFAPSEIEPFAFFVGELLLHLAGSDFQVVFPGYSTICTIHNRCQLWWTTTEAAVIDRLDALMPADGNKHATNIDQPAV